MTQLPGIAGEIEEIIGIEATVRLLKERGGTEVFIPMKPANSALARIIGELATGKLRDAFGPGEIKLPCAGMRGQDARRRQAMKLLAEGKPHSQVALACDVDLRSVERYAARLRDVSDSQPELPF